MSKAIKLLGRKVPLLLKRYRDNRDAQRIKHWNKQKDLRQIDAAWQERKNAAYMEASAGRFWFKTKTGRIIQVDADRYWQPKLV